MQKAQAIIKHFTDLIVWQKGYQLVLGVYKLFDSFPKEEKFGLRSQMSRAVVSITSNIAEGFGRRSFKEKIRFYQIARGSVFEIENQLIISKDLSYIHARDYQDIVDCVHEVSRLLQGLINSTRRLDQEK